MEGCFTMNRACIVIFGCLLAGIIHADMMVSDIFNSNHELNNIVFYNNTVYIAGNGWLFVLDETLQHLSDVSTCSGGTSCNNVNQVLLLNRDKNKLILCGTGNQGRCHTRSLDNLFLLDHDSKNDDNTLLISNDTHRPAVALVNSYDGTLTIGVTYSANLESVSIQTAEGLSYKYPLSTRRAESPFEVADHKTLPLRLPKESSDPLHRNPLENFLLYFKAAFQNNNFSYFFTNQKKLVGKGKYISKMIRICQKDARFRSYTDVIMECIKDGKNYNLLQDVTIVEPGVTPGVDSGDRLFVGTFTSADNPEDVSGDSAICVEKLSKLNEKVLKVKQEEIQCTNSQIQTDKRYLQQQWICNISVFNEDLALCNTNIATYVFIIGQSPHTMTAKYTLPTDNGYITSVAGHIAGSTGTVVIQAGTSRGHLLQMNLESLDKPLHEFERLRVQRGSPIQKIFTKGGNSTDPTFIMTLSKVFRYRQTNCSEFHTCKEMVDRRNPYCGWCAYLGRSTTQEECPTKGDNHWLSSLKSCLYIETTPKGQEANRKTGQVRLTVTNQPAQLPGDKYECLFRIGPKILQQGPATTKQNGTLLCETPALADTAHVSLQLLLRTSTNHTVTLGQAAFLYYRCEQFTQCGVCTNTEGARCEWCSELARCQTSCGDQPVVKQISQCVHVLNDTQNLRYIPSEIKDKVTFDLEGDVLSSMHIRCYNPEKNVTEDATLDAKKVTCNLTLPISAGERKTRYRVILRYATHMSAGHYADIDDEFSSFVTVYRCESLARDCSQCKGLNSTRYKCDWCSSGSCNYNDGVCQPTSQCPAPHITSVVPPDAPTQGRTQVTINGTNLGIHVSQVESMSLAGVSCSYVQKLEDLAPYGDFQKLVPNLLSCEVGETNLSSAGVAGLVEVTVNGQQSTGKVIFTYQNPFISDVSPTFGPLAGGTDVTFTGNNLGIGNQNVQVSFEDRPLDNCRVKQQLDEHNVQYEISCRVPSGLKQNFTSLRLSYGTDKYYEFKKSFSLRANPVIENIVPKAAILSGGNKMMVSGTFLTNAHRINIYAFYNGLMTNSTCKPLSDKLVECSAPVAPNSVIEDLHGKLPDQSARRKRNAPCMCMEVGISVQLDGVTYNDTIEYFPDPVFDKFTEDGAVYKYDKSSQRLNLTGKYLNLVVDKYDILVTIGAETCAVVELTETSLTCVMPTDAPKPVSSSSSFPEVNVTIGKLSVNIGYVEYKGNNLALIISLVIVGLVLLIIVIGVLVYLKLRQQKRQNQMLEKKYKDREMEIRQVVRQEFHDMHMTMTNVNKNLVEQGFPYHGYQQFASNIMFASDIRQADQTGEGQKEMKGTLQDLEELVLNKKFLKTVIITMEKEKKFFHKKRATLAGNLCAVLIGRMDYVKELLQDLLAELVEEAMANNKHKTLFRTCERITENLLSNWLSLNLYSHFKSSAGSPLYMLYMVMQFTIESGPIDAITQDAKYTLCEEKLLKKWDTTEGENADVKIEAKPLTVQVVVDDGDQTYECRVLDCDTITQVKTKCLNQIYQNYPASSLEVNPKDLSLEWHSGYSGSLSLMDEDASSIVEGRWKRLNTLAHYNVKDNSKLALIDPNNTDSKENYANLLDVNVSSPLYANRNAVGETSVAGTSHDEENPLLLTTWHLVKRNDEVTEQTDRSVLEDLYLNRLFTAKQSILDYMHKLFNAVMDEHQCPPPTKFLYDLLDELGEKNKVDPDVIHAWKSHSYPIRVWGTLIKQPSKLFDIHVPVYVEDSLDVIAQVFIESFNLIPQKFTKDSSAQKQIFHSEMNQYREKVKEFYSGVSNVVQTPDDLKMYLANVNAQQQSFKKLTYLRKFFNQLKPFTDNILDDLEAVDPKLKQKFENVLDKMEEHENDCESERL